MVASARGIIDWNMTRDREGHRTYNSVWQVITTSHLDGPAQVINASGLPALGSPWSIGNDFDSWAKCWPTATIRPFNTRDKNYWWTVDITHTTKPFFRCQDYSVEDPLLEPVQISGSFVNHKRMLEQDKDGDAILSSSHEQIVGLEIDEHKATVTIKQNVADSGLSTYTNMMNTLNDAALWGLAARKIKLNSVSWSRKYYGACSVYYTRQLDFEIRFDGYDLDDIPDMGFKHLRGTWVDDTWVYDAAYDNATERANPENFVIIKDKDDENTPVRVMLDGNGKRNTDPTVSPTFLPTIQGYAESNFLLLDIPTSL